VVEGTVVAFTFSSFFYFKDFEKYIAEDKKIVIGFIQIGILSFSLGV
jgi:hypothetical protein